MLTISATYTVESWALSMLWYKTAFVLGASLTRERCMGECRERLSASNEKHFKRTPYSELTYTVLCTIRTREFSSVTSRVKFRSSSRQIPWQRIVHIEYEKCFSIAVNKANFQAIIHHGLFAYSQNLHRIIWNPRSSAPNPWNGVACLSFLQLGVGKVVVSATESLTHTSPKTRADQSSARFIQVPRYILLGLPNETLRVEKQIIQYSVIRSRIIDNFTRRNLDCVVADWSSANQWHIKFDERSRSPRSDF